MEKRRFGASVVKKDKFGVPQELKKCMFASEKKAHRHIQASWHLRDETTQARGASIREEKM